MSDIKQWLNSNRKYSEGVALYLIHGSSEFLKKRFQAGADTYNKSKLVEELQKLTVVSKKEESHSKPSEKDHVRYLSLLQKRDDILRQIDRNITLLDISKAPAVLFETAKQILRLHQSKTEVWALIDFYQAHGYFELPTEKKEVSKEREMQLLYQAISKAKKRLSDPHCKSPGKTKLLKAKHEARLHQLKSI